MPKKQAAASKPPPLSNRDHLERANFALQASLLLQTACPSFAPSAVASSSSTASASQLQPQPSRTKPADDRKGKRKAFASSYDDTAEPVTTRMGRSTMRSFSKWTVHNQVKLDPDVKRAICQCAAVLVPGLTCKVRVKPNKNHCNVVVKTCLSCGAQHRLPAPPQSLSTAEGLDGPVRTNRRAKKARGAPQHRREQPNQDFEAESAIGVDVKAAEALGDDDPSPKNNGGKNNNNGRGGKKGGKKQPGRGGGGDNGGDGPGVDGVAPTGHVLWRGSERVGGWGTLERDANKETTLMSLPYRPQHAPNHDESSTAHTNGQANGVVHPDAPATSPTSTPPESTTNCSNN